MRSAKIIIVCVTILIVLVTGLLLADKYGNLGLLDTLLGKGMQIEKTANVVTEVRNISEFVSACYYEELTLIEKKDADNTINTVAGWFGKKGVSKDELCLLAKGKVRAGFNLSKVAEDAILVNGDTLTMTLPEPEIFDVIINPSDYEVYVEDGTWTHDQVTAIQANTRARIKEDALAFGLLEKADKLGRERLTDLFKTFGFAEVVLK